MVEGRPAFGATLIGGKAYIPHDRAESILGIRIRWSPGMKEAEVLTPKVTISGSDRVERGFLRDGQVLVPLRSIANHLGVTLGWNQASRTAYVGGNPVEASCETAGFMRRSPHSGASWTTCSSPGMRKSYALSFGSG